MALPAGRFTFHLQRLGADGRWHAVQRHVNERGDAARGRRPGGGGESFPLGVSRLAKVHVRVDQPWHEYHVRAQVEHLLAAEPAAAQRLDRSDPGAGDRYGKRALRLTRAAGDSTGSPDEQVGGHRS